MYLDEKEVHDRLTRNDNFLRVQPKPTTPAPEEVDAPLAPAVPSPLFPEVVHKKFSHGRELAGGRKHGSANIPEPLKLLVTATARTDGIRAAAALGVSNQSAKDLSCGREAHAKENEGKVQDLLNINKRKALERLELALDGITPEKLEGAKLKELSSVARDMASIAEGSRQRETTQATQVIIYNTPEKQVSSYEVVPIGS